MKLTFDLIVRMVICAMESALFFWLMGSMLLALFGPTDRP